MTISFCRYYYPIFFFFLSMKEFYLTAFIQIESTGDCVVAINTRHVALRNDAWRSEAFHVRREYAKTRYDIPLFKLHELDPTKVRSYESTYFI